MAPPTASERQRALLQQEIAKLSGAISQHASRSGTHPSYHPYRGSTRGASRGGYRPRGKADRRGGASYSLDLRNAAAGPSTSVAPSVTGLSSVAAHPGTAEGTQGKEWIKGSGGMSLMTVEKRKQLAAKKRVPPQIQPVASTDSSEGKRVVIDGVVFKFEDGGKKLTRVDDAATASPTRHSLTYGGERFRRTKKGNLISRPSRAEQADMPCRFFTKTGRCQRALTCPYKHDPSRLAICPRFLRGTCPLTAATCALSHVPSAHNTPSCVHFQRTASCSRPNCVYPHVRVANDSLVCEDFARGGWCDREEGTCPNLHVWECPEWRASGTCERVKRGARCGLPHIIRAEVGRAEVAAQAGVAASAEGDTGAGGFEDQAEFIGLGPGEPSDYSDSDGESSEGSDDGDAMDEDGDEAANQGESPHHEDADALAVGAQV
ncbi:hypothetical protein Q5752_004253 [Cryptotrichosporon argae]